MCIENPSDLTKLILTATGYHVFLLMCSFDIFIKKKKTFQSKLNNSIINLDATKFRHVNVYVLPTKEFNVLLFYILEVKNQIISN